MEKAVEGPGFLRRWSAPAAIVLVFAAAAASSVAIVGPRHSARMVIQPAAETPSRGRGVVEVISGEAADGTRVNFVSEPEATSCLPGATESTG